jgi:hypothetical protein
MRIRITSLLPRSTGRLDSEHEIIREYACTISDLVRDRWRSIGFSGRQGRGLFARRGFGLSSRLLGLAVA